MNTRKQISLSTMLSDGTEITEGQIDGMVDLFGKHCMHNTKRRLRSILTYGFSSLSNWSIYQRVMFDGDEVSYYAGQSYPDEIRSIRQLILK